MRTMGRITGAMVVVAMAMVVGTASAGAQEGQGCGEGDLCVRCPEGVTDVDSQVVASGRTLVIDSCTNVDGVIIAGDADVLVDKSASVDGPVIVGNGTAVIRGDVTGDVVVLRGRAVVEDSANVDGNVYSSLPPRVADGARVGGDIERVRFTQILDALGLAVRIAWWVAVSVSTLVAGLVFTGAFGGMARRAVEAGRGSVGASIATGVIAAIGLPIVSALLVATLIASPLGLTGLFALAPLYLAGYVAGALFLGSLIIQGRRGPVLSFTLGWLILRLVGVLPILGGLITVAATIYGLGALLLAVWRLTRPADGGADELDSPVELPPEAAPVAT